MNTITKLSDAEYLLILRRDLMSFIERSFYELNPQIFFSLSLHIEVMASRLQAYREGKIRRLIVNQPPRSLKSQAVSVALAAWILGHDPSKQIICASYGQDLADKHARDCRTLMMSDFYQIPEKQPTTPSLGKALETDKYISRLRPTASAQTAQFA